MTREEAIEILNQTFINTDGHIKPSNPKKLTALDIHQALTMAIQALSVSLPPDVDEAAIDFADFARKQPKDYAIAAIADYDHGCIDGFKAGAEWMRTKMQEDAVEADVKLTLHDKTGDVSLHTGYLPKELGIKYGDRVRIIILKEEQK